MFTKNCITRTSKCSVLSLYDLFRLENKGSSIGVCARSTIGRQAILENFCGVVAVWSRRYKGASSICATHYIDLSHKETKSVQSTEHIPQYPVFVALMFLQFTVQSSTDVRGPTGLPELAAQMLGVD